MCHELNVICEVVNILGTYVMFILLNAFIPVCNIMYIFNNKLVGSIYFIYLLIYFCVKYK